MERALLHLAHQLNAYDEASLSALWNTLAARVEHFEPSVRWEEDCLALGLIQMLRWKNQLFNHNLAESQAQARHSAPQHAPRRFPDELINEFSESLGADQVDTMEEATDSASAFRQNAERSLSPNTQKRAKVLAFRPVKHD